MSYPPPPPNYPPPAPPPPGQPFQGQPQPGGAPQNTLGLVGMILGIISIPFACCFGAGLLFGIVGAVLGYLGRQKAAQGLATNDGQAKAGFITGLVGVGLSLLWIIANFALSINLPGYNA